MIRYSKKYWGLHVLFRMYGSAFPRALPFSVSSAALAGFLAAFFPTSTEWELFKHPYPFQTFAFVAGFMIVFRSNLSYGRYWEGRTQLQLMTTKLTDAVVMSLQFDRTAVPKVGATKEQIAQHAWFRDTIVHLISLMHAVALATLREDFNMENLVAHDSFAQAPPYNVRRSDLDDVDEESEEPQSSSSSGGGGGDGGAAANGKRGGADGGASAKPTRLRHSTSQAQLDKAHSLAGIRSFKDYFILRTDPEHAQHIHRAMKLPVIGGFTQAEGVALGAFTTSGDQGAAVPNLDVGIHGTILGDGTYAPAPTERVHTVLAWVQQVLIERIHDGGVRAAPPIQSRIHQVLSDSMLGYEQCKKLTETPFPFPWAQAVNIVLLVFCLTLPMIVVAFAKHPYVAAIVTFIAAHTHVMLNEVARDIEDPFHYDPNELPLPQMQYKLNERLLAVTRSKRPLAFTDIGDLTGPGNTVQMHPSPAPLARGSASQPATIQAGTAADVADPFSASSAAQTAAPPPPPAVSPAPSSIHGTSLATINTLPLTPGSPGGPSSPAATSCSLEPQMTERPVPIDAGDACAYSTANVPQEVAEPAMRWRSIAGNGSKTRRRRVPGRGADGAADSGGASPDEMLLQSTPAMRAAAPLQRGSRRMMSMPARPRLSTDQSSQLSYHSHRGERMEPYAGAEDPQHLQVVVAANDAPRQSGGAVESAEQVPTSASSVPPLRDNLSFQPHKSISFAQVQSVPPGHGAHAVSASGGAQPALQADPGASPFGAEDAPAEAAGAKAVPSVAQQSGASRTQL